MSATRFFQVLAGAVGLLLLGAAPGAAVDAELVSIPLDEVVRGEPGEVILVATVSVPEELVGLRCEMVGETVNQRSVHVGNDLLIQLGDETSLLLNYEDESGVRYEFRAIEELPAVIEVFVRLGPDGVTSGGFLLTVSCPEQPPTSSSTTTTSVPESTTTVPESTSTSSTVTSSSTSTSSTVTSSSTTTTVISGPSVEPSVPPPSVAPAVEQPKLAVTGAAPIGLAVLGFSLLAAGGIAVIGGTRRTRSSG